MKPSLFLTGAGGFAGSHLLGRLDTSKYHTIYCLTRRYEAVRPPVPVPENIKIIEGDLLDTDSYVEYLEHVDIVVHMAAATGKVSPRDYFNVNTEATGALLEQCKKAGVSDFLFISSIAVAFPNKYRYFYAQSKEQAEALVKNSGLNFTILRPTMIMGNGSPVFDGLAKMAGLPLIPVFGNGKAQVQPVHVTDVAKGICSIVDTRRFSGEVLELGGPTALSIEDFMKKIPQIGRGKTPGALHLPIGLIVFFLSIMERFVYGLLPITVGQLASFRNPGAARSNSLTDSMAGEMVDIDGMIGDSLETDSPEDADVPEPLKSECNVFCKYLTGQPATPYVLKQYARCFEKIDFTPADFHDKLLLKIAKIRPLLTRSADAYSRFFRPTSTVRKRLSYLMAILEVTPPYFRYYDSVDEAGKLGLLVKMGLNGTAMVFHIFFSALFLLPLQVVAKVTSKSPEPAKQAKGGH